MAELLQLLIKSQLKKEKEMLAVLKYVCLSQNIHYSETLSHFILSSFMGPVDGEGQENKELIKLFQVSSEIPSFSLICVFSCNLYSYYTINSH